MKIVTSGPHNPEIEIIEINGELTGRGAIQLAEFLYASLDEGKCYKIIDLKCVKKVDGLGLKVMEYFINRGMHIRLFRVGLEIQNLLELSGKEDIIKTYDCQERDKALALLKKEIMEEKDTVKDDVKRRRHPRFNISFQTEFKYSIARNAEIAHKANVLNLSEGGIFAGLITAFNTRTGKMVDAPEIAGRELYDIKFDLNGSSRLIVTNGKCVWETRKYGKLYAGICFKDVKQNYIEMIRDYVRKQIHNQNIV